jgi:hypothetical protein
MSVLHLKIARHIRTTTKKKGETQTIEIFLHLVYIFAEIDFKITMISMFKKLDNKLRNFKTLRS